MDHVAAGIQQQQRSAFADPHRIALERPAQINAHHSQAKPQRPLFHVAGQVQGSDCLRTAHLAERASGAELVAQKARTSASFWLTRQTGVICTPSMQFARPDEIKRISKADLFNLQPNTLPSVEGRKGTGLKFFNDPACTGKGLQAASLAAHRKAASDTPEAARAWRFAGVPR